MALIECPECGREVSSSAAACPTCAYPVMTGTPPIPPPAVKRGSKHEWWKTAASIVNRLTVGALLFAFGGDADLAPIAAVIGGLIVGASAIPVFYRDRIERLKSARLDSAQRGPELTAGLADRMAEMEHLHQEQIADLEERVEFAERLLTKQREESGPG